MDNQTPKHKAITDTEMFVFLVLLGIAGFLLGLKILGGCICLRLASEMIEWWEKKGAK